MEKGLKINRELETETKVNLKNVNIFLKLNGS